MKKLLIMTLFLIASVSTFAATGESDSDCHEVFNQAAGKGEIESRDTAGVPERPTTRSTGESTEQ